MKYFETSPGPVVGKFVKCYWALEDDAPIDSSQTIVPDGRCELIINLARSFQSWQDEQWKSQPQVFLVGQITQPLKVRPDGPARIIGVRFHPHGAGQLLGLPMNELTNSVISLDELSKPLQLRLEELQEPGPMARKLPALDQIMFDCAQRTADHELRMAFAVATLEQSAGLVRVSELAAQIGLSSRQFERRFKHEVGISPKLFGRLQRFQRVWQAAEHQALNWVDTAIDCGYYDQAHLIRDFHEFAGRTPTALLTAEFELTRNFVHEVARASRP
jgi:AraC-like DNA-binding protein